MKLTEIQEKDGQIIAKFERVVIEEKPVTREALEEELKNITDEIKGLESQMVEIENKFSELENKKAPIEEFLSQSND